MFIWVIVHYSLCTYTYSQVYNNIQALPIIIIIVWLCCRTVIIAKAAASLYSYCHSSAAGRAQPTRGRTYINDHVLHDSPLPCLYTHIARHIVNTAPSTFICMLYMHTGCLIAACLLKTIFFVSYARCMYIYYYFFFLKRHTATN